MNTTSYRRRLWESVAKHLLPCLTETRQWQALLAEPPFYLPSGCEVHYHSGQPLEASQASNSQESVGRLHTWLETKVHSTHAPFFGYVVSGDIDLRIGITREMATRLQKPASGSDYAVISISQNTFFTIPPGVPHGQGLHGHWERSTPPQPGTSILWIHFLAPGVLCHQSWYTEEEYTSKGSYFLPDVHLLPVINMLIDQQRQRAKSSPQLVHSALSLIGYSLERDLQILQPGELKSFRPNIDHGNTASQIVNQAIAYIETHYKENLSISQIAAHCFVSPSHLSRLFKAEKEMTVHQYLTRTRLEYACTMLRETQLGIKQICSFVGYPNRSHFCRIFTQEYGCSPSKYKNKSHSQHLGHSRNKIDN